MADLLDSIILGSVAYYLATKSKEEDESFNRALAAVAAGTITYVKGPDVYDSLKNYFDDDATQQQKDRILASVVLGATGYITGDKIGDSLRGNKGGKP
ncbi:MAG: hypothetical protein ACMXX9_03580 [Candidatus Woesearchaeota archaeon]